MKNERGEITTDTSEIQKKKRMLWKITHQQLGQSKRNGQVSGNVRTAYQKWIKKKSIIWTDQTLLVK